VKLGGESRRVRSDRHLARPNESARAVPPSAFNGLAPPPGPARALLLNRCHDLEDNRRSGFFEEEDKVENKKTKKSEQKQKPKKKRKRRSSRSRDDDAEARLNTRASKH
jgi:hypothetical protein